MKFALRQSLVLQSAMILQDFKGKLKKFTYQFEREGSEMLKGVKSFVNEKRKKVSFYHLPSHRYWELYSATI